MKRYILNLAYDPTPSAACKSIDAMLLEKEELEEKATASVNGSGNRRIVVVGQMSGKPRAIVRDRK